jgi:carbonic anhydrase
LAQSLKPASLQNGEWKDSGAGSGSHAGDFIEWLTIRNQEESVLADVERIKSHPLVPPDIPVYGYVYDVKTGRLIEVKQASAAAAAL